MKKCEEINLDVNRIRELLMNLQELTNLRFSLHTIGAEELVTVNRRSDFCNMICQTKFGYQKCFTSDLKGIEAAKTIEKPFQYRCHAGLIDTAIPIYENRKLEATILFGQILDDSPIEQQWQRTERNCSWYNDLYDLKRAFCRLPRLSSRAIRAAYEIINTCVSEVRLSQLRTIEQMSDFDRLLLYLRTNYAKSLHPGDIADDLAIPKSRLYRIVSDDSGGRSLSMLIAEERVHAAKRMLKTTSASIREVGALVGFCDYNYFTKVFRRYTGRTPSAYRAEKVLVSAELPLGELHREVELDRSSTGGDLIEKD